MISIKAGAGLSGRMQLKMTRLTLRGKDAASLSACWRRGLIYWFAFLIVLAPVVQAACSVEHLANQLASSHRGAPSALETRSASAVADAEACCDQFISQSAAPSADERLAAPTPGAAGFVARSWPVRTVAFHEPSNRRHAEAPVEPVFRRVPRLLI